MGCGASKPKGSNQSTPSGTPEKTIDKGGDGKSGKGKKGKGVENPDRPQPMAAFRTPRTETQGGNKPRMTGESTAVEPILRKSVTFSNESGKLMPKAKTETEPKTILKHNPLRLSSSSFNAETIDDYGDQLFGKLEALAGKIVQGYTPREEKPQLPDRSELIIPEIKYGYLSEPTPRDSVEGIQTVEGRSPAAINGVTNAALPLWESSNTTHLDMASRVSHICDVELLSSSRLLVTRNGPAMAGICLYDVTRDGHRVIGDGSLAAPRGVTVDRAEQVIVVTDWEDKTVKFVDYEGQHRGSWKENKFKHPGGIARTREGRYIISDVTRGDQALREYSAYGKMIRKFGLSWFDWPWYIATDSKGRVIVSERSASTIYIFDNTGGLLTKFGGHGRSQDKLSSPSGVTIDTSDNILIADSENYRVCMFSPDGRFIKNTASHYLARPTSLALYEGKLTIATETSVKLCELQPEKQFL